MLVVRPRRARRAAWARAVAVVAVFTAVASVLRSTDTGVVFRLADQVAMVYRAALLAAGILLLARPRVRAIADGIEVRNTGWARYLPWELVRAVSFPDGACRGRLDLPDHEYLAVLAVQSADGLRAWRRSALCVPCTPGRPGRPHPSRRYPGRRPRSLPRDRPRGRPRGSRAPRPATAAVIRN